MSEERRYQKIEAVLRAEGYSVELRTKKDRSIRFSLYIDDSFRQVLIEDLGLSERSKNCLKRAGINNIGEFTEHIKSSSDLKAIRNCGTKCVAEIMQALWLYQYQLFDIKGKRTYIEELIRLNADDIERR